MSLSGEDAAARARTARERAAELDERLGRLRAGEPVTSDDVARAEEAAARQEARSVAAHRHAAHAHQEAARHHRHASELLDSYGHAPEAEEHRRKAVVDDEAAEQALRDAARAGVPTRPEDPAPPDSPAPDGRT